MQPPDPDPDPPAEPKTPADDSQTLPEESKTLADATASPHAKFPIPEIRDHELITRVGQGSYGEVWLARNVMGFYRAVKIVYRATFEHARPFDREFNGIKKFEPISRSHDGLVDILQVGRTDDYFYYVMEIADDVATGQEIDPAHYTPRTLRSAATEQGKMGFEDCVQIGLSLTQALGHMHKHGLIHRDIKPANIIFVHGQAKLADIGLVAEQSEAKSFVGTEGFISPEGPGTPQADIYSLGKVLYEIATGKDRHEFPTLPTLLGEADSDTHLLELNSVFLKACQGDLKQRYQTCEQMRDDLLLLQGGKSVKRSQAVERRLRRLTEASIVGVTVTLMAIAAMSYAKKQERKAQLHANREAALRAEAEGAEAEARRNLYAADMLLAQRAFEDSNTGRAVQLLERYNTRPERRILRDWEWRFLWSRTRSDATWRAQGHPRTIHSMAVSPDGKLAATGGNEGTIVVWDLNTRNKLSTLVRSNTITSLAFSRDHLLAATEAGERRVWLWDVGHQFSSLQPIEISSDALSVAFSVDGAMMAVGAETEVTLWGTKAWQRTEPVLTPRVRALAFAPTGELLALAQADGWISLWDCSTSKIVRRVRGALLDGIACSLTFSQDSKLLGRSGSETAFGRSAEIWSVPGLTLAAVLTNHQAWVGSVSFSRDGRFAATGSADQTVKLWDVGNWREVANLRGHMNEIWTLAFSPTADILLTGDKSGIVRAFNAAPPERSTTELALVPNSVGIKVGSCARFATVLSAEREWSSLDLDSGNMLPLGKLPAGVGDASAFGRHDQLIALPQSDGQIVLREASTGKLQGIIRAEADPRAHLALSADGLRLAIVNAHRSIRVFDTDSGSALATLPQSTWSIDCLAFSDSGDRLAIALDRAYALEIWDWQRRRLINRLTGHSAPINNVVFLPNSGTTIATGSLDATVRIWDFNSGNMLHTLGGQLTAIYALAVSPDGKRLAASGGDGIIRLWDLGSKQQVAALKSGHPLVRHLAFDATGSTLVSGANDAIRFWRAPSVTEVEANEKPETQK